MGGGVRVLLIFMIQNTQRVRLDFLFWTFTWPLWLLTMASALLGALVWVGLLNQLSSPSRTATTLPASRSNLVAPATQIRTALVAVGTGSGR
jgi:hypothetical protein